MTLRKTGQSLEFELQGDHTAAERAIAMVKLGDKMDEFCDMKSSQCDNPDGCVIGAQSSVYETAVWVEVGCHAEFRARNLGGCALATQTARSTEAEIASIVSDLQIRTAD